MQSPIVSPFTYNPDIFCTLASMPHETASEQRAIDWRKIIETALTAPGNVGNTYNRFYEYSFLNQMYLLMQGVHEPVATWARWKAIGRHIVKGAEGKYIIRPVHARVDTPTAHEADEETDESVKVVPTLIGFKLVKCIFALSDTAGKW
jgi:N-terminal domain of anti-restriction factor ArdC